MTSLVLLIPISLVILALAGVALFWAVDHGQFEEMESSALLPMLDGDAPSPQPSPKGEGETRSSPRPSPTEEGQT